MQGAGSSLTGKLNTGTGTNIGKAAQLYRAQAAAAVQRIKDRYGAMQGAGSTMTSRLASGVGSGQGRVSGNARNAASAAVGGAKAFNGGHGKFYWAGIGMDEGMAAGIRAGQWRVTNAIANVAEAAVRTANAKLKINSPSKVFREIGDGINEGWSQGIERTASMTVGAVESVAESIVDAGSTSVFTSSTRAGGYAMSGGGYVGAPVVNISGNTFEVANDMDARHVAEIVGTEVQRQMAGRVA